jgi:hypothetical protein
MNKTAKMISNTIYGVGVAIVAACIGCLLFGRNITPFPEAMLAFTLSEIASFWLAIGSIPMVLACMAVYKFNGIKSSSHKKRNFVLVFLPGFVCAASAVFWIVVLIIGYVNMFLHWGS